MQLPSPQLKRVSVITWWTDWLTEGRSRDLEKSSTFSEYIGPSWVDWSNNLLLLEYNE